ncbi:MAG: PaaI family thioesterase [Bacillota bacterium]
MKTVNEGIDDRLFNIIVATNAQAPFYQLTGITTKALGPGWAEMAVQTETRHGNPLGLTHGGIVSTLADAAMANAVRTTGKKGVTVNYDISFLNTAPVGQEMVGRGRVDKAGSKIIFTSVEVVCGDKVIASSQGTFYVVGEIELD